MSSETRKYELKARAESQEQTRRRIAKAAAELHEEVGPAATTVAEIARRAGVSRLTVYRHFPDNASLYPACAAHYRQQHPIPDFEPSLAIEDPIERVRSVLGTAYGGYRDSRKMLRNLLRDRAVDSVLDRQLRETRDAPLVRFTDVLASGFRARGSRDKRVRTIIGIALDFRTWDRLAEQGYEDAEAADLMTEVIAGVAGRPAREPVAAAP